MSQPSGDRGGTSAPYRTEAGLTLEKLAEKAELSWPYLSEIEPGVRIFHSINSPDWRSS